jgi:gluconokinase
VSGFKLRRQQDAFEGGVMTAMSPQVILLMGVMGSGKTTIGELLAERLNWSFVDADDYHPLNNVEKMARGAPLTDADRLPWLRTLSTVIDGWLSTAGAALELPARAARQDAGVVLACSALKHEYREILVGQKLGVRVVFLKGSEALLQARLLARQHAFMPPELLQSQLATLEAPIDALTVDIAASPEALVDQIRASLFD